MSDHLEQFSRSYRHVYARETDSHVDRGRTLLLDRARIDFGSKHLRPFRIESAFIYVDGRAAI